MAVEIISGVITIELISAVGPQGAPGSLNSINSVTSVIGNVDIEADVASAITVTPDDPGDKVTIGETHSPRVDNPHAVTAAQAGAEPADPALQTHLTDTANPHAVSAAQAGAEPANANIQAHIVDTANPHAVTAVQAGADPAGSAAAVQGNLTTHEADVANPHAVTAAQTGADPSGSAAAVQANLTTHEGDVGNPHAVTAAQAGAEPANANIQGHIIDTSNPHVVTAAQAGATPIAHATDTTNPHAVTAVQAGADPAGSAAAVAGDLSTHEADTANPHAATFTQAVTADAGTDISAAEAETLTDGSIADALHTHAGAGGNSLQLNWRFSTTTTSADPGAGRFRYNDATPGSVTELFMDDFTQNGFDASAILNKMQVGDEMYIQQADDASRFLLVTLSADPVDNVGWFTIAVTIEGSGVIPGNNKDCGFLLLTFGSSDLSAHLADLANPHAVTAAQAGADPAGSAGIVAGDLSTHEADVANPHAVTAAQAGATPIAHATDTANPHTVTFTQAVTADPGTDISAAEAETLTDGSDADALHSHPAVEAAAAGPYLLTGQWGQAASAMDNKVAILGTGLMGDVVLTADGDAITVDADGVGVELDTTAAVGNDTSVRAGATNGTRLDQLPIFTTRFKLNVTTNRRFFGGLAPLASIPTDDNSLDGAEGVGVVYSSDRVDTNFQFVAHDGTIQTLVDTGVAVDTAVHHVEIVAASAASVTVRLLDADGVEEATTTFTTELPAGTIAMVPSATLTAVAAVVQTWTFYSMSVIVP